MLSRVLRFLQDFAPQDATEGEADRDHRLQLVTSALLIEMVRADDDEDDAEREAVIRVLQRVFALDPAEIAELLDLATERADAATSLHEFTAYLNQELDPPGKLRVIEMLWEVAYADGRLDKYEDYLVRKVAELIYVPHTQFIRAKLMVRERLEKR